jgi:hypothetical protein
VVDTTLQSQCSDLSKSIGCFVTEGVEQIDLGNIRSLLVKGEEILRYVSGPKHLEALISSTLQNPALLAKCERFNLFQKIVLFEHPATKVRLRLHMFGDEVREVHHHRASFAALVLRGSYTHLLFGDERYVDDSAGGRPGFRLLMAQEQRAGTAYALDHAMMHATLAKPETVSLILQAPVARPSFRIYDLETGERRDRVGSSEAMEVQEAGEAAMTAAEIEASMSSLRSWGVI